MPQPVSAQSSVGGAPFSSLPGRQSCLKIGMCGGYADNTTAADEPLAYVDVLVMGPIVVRASAYHAVGGFNISYCPPASRSGLRGCLSSHLWASGRGMPSRARLLLCFHNGCGGQGTLTHHGPKRGDRERREAGRRSNALWESEFPPPLGLSTVRAKIETARRELRVWRWRGRCAGYAMCCPRRRGRELRARVRRRRPNRPGSREGQGSLCGAGRRVRRMHAIFKF